MITYNPSEGMTGCRYDSEPAVGTASGRVFAQQVQCTVHALEKVKD